MAASRLALILPANGMEIGLVSYSFSQRDEPRVPYLDGWMGDAFSEQGFATFYVDAAESPGAEGTFIQAVEPSHHGCYLLYYTLSSLDSVNEICRQLIGDAFQEGRLFWRGNVLLIKYRGSLGVDHEYLDVPSGIVAAVVKFIRHCYENRELEKSVASEAGLTEAAHKVIVCTQSRVLAAAVRGGFAEAETNEIEVDFDVDTVDRMLDFLYTKDYRVESTPEAILCHARMNAIADYYDISQLVALANSRIDHAFREDWSAEAFFSLVRELSHSTGDTALHKLVASAAADHIEELVEMDAFADLGGLGDFAAGVLGACAARIQKLRSQLQHTNYQLAAERISHRRRRRRRRLCEREQPDRASLGHDSDMDSGY
ncbi:hypothetical protein NKR23_g10918 [Pleurostoma richardsiae]|uniref:BTB domain-containing protein n=1 Tax=Pleurostoma richardsiae TaxID=41990 RepID=A0AA38RD89_9PEZI|nr:hypothetical protein NKR23_g10918 [Pleurostoma richardsiae]